MWIHVMIRWFEERMFDQGQIIVKVTVQSQHVFLKFSTIRQYEERVFDSGKFMVEVIVQCKICIPKGL